MSDCDYEHIVVGGGINGLWTAYHLARRGASVLLLEKVSMTYGRNQNDHKWYVFSISYFSDILIAISVQEDHGIIFINLHGVGFNCFFRFSVSKRKKNNVAVNLFKTISV